MRSVLQLHVHGRRWNSKRICKPRQNGRNDSVIHDARKSAEERCDRNRGDQLKKAKADHAGHCIKKLTGLCFGTVTSRQCQTTTEDKLPSGLCAAQRAATCLVTFHEVQPLQTRTGTPSMHFDRSSCILYCFCASLFFFTAVSADLWEVNYAFIMVGVARRKSQALTTTALAFRERRGLATISLHKSKTPAHENCGGLREKYGDPERPLRLVLVGHNPSAAAWRDGHYYSNPSNRMWSLLRNVKIIPEGYTAKDDDRCPSTCGIGFTDLGYGNPGTDSSNFKAPVLHAWRRSLYQRLLSHARRAGAPPKIVAFTGKRQFRELFFDSKAYKSISISYGLQSARPDGFPFNADETKLFVLTSSSGAAAMSNAAREMPYQELAELLKQIPWEVPPLKPPPVS